MLSPHPTSPVPSALRLHDVGFSFAAQPVVFGVSLRLAPGTFFSLLGPSGGGKTTLLRLIGGYLRPTSGRIHLHERDVTALPPERRDIGMVFQSYALFPHMTARENVAFGLEMRRVPRSECRQRVEAMLERVGLTAGERGRRPGQLSGGQQQRVALARALVIEPSLLLLDEPLANLDRHLREQMRGELRELQRRSRVTTLLVTHDREEALTLADRVGVLAAGRLLQDGPPLEVYQRPRCPYVARLLGDANFFTIEDIQADRVYLAGGLCVPKGKAGDWHKGGCVMIRPEQCLLGGVGWPGRIVTAQYLGCDWVVEVDVGAGQTVRLRRRAGAGTPPRPGETVVVDIPAEACWPLPEPDPAWLPAARKDEADVLP